MQPITNNKTQLGAKGEQIACNYLQQMGFTILDKNWRYIHLEVDIIATKENVIHVIEVKTRNVYFFERPQDAVSKKKQAFLVRAINQYISRLNFNGEIQFDIITILLEHGKKTIDYIPDAFYPLCK